MIESQTLRIVRSTLSDGRTFEAKLTCEPDGTPVDLMLSVDYADAHGWRNQAGVLALPPSAIPQLREALNALEAR